MPNSILSSYNGKSSFSLVRENGGKNIAVGLSVLKVNISLRSRAMRHMREDGTSIVDCRIIEPIMISADVISDSLDEIGNISAGLLDRSSLYTVTSKGLIFYSMMMDDNVINQSSGLLNASPLKLSFKQVLLQGVKAKVFLQPPDSTLMDRGLQILDQASYSVQQLAVAAIAQIRI